MKGNNVIKDAYSEDWMMQVNGINFNCGKNFKKLNLKFCKNKNRKLNLKNKKVSFMRVFTVLNPIHFTSL